MLEGWVVLTSFNEQSLKNSKSERNVSSDAEVTKTVPYLASLWEPTVTKTSAVNKICVADKQKSI